MKLFKDWTPVQRNVVVASYLGWTLDAFDFLLITFVAEDIARAFHTDTKAVGLANLLTLGLRPLGAFIFGRLADRFGRRPILMLDVALYSVFAFSSAFAPNLMTFLLLRALFGVAMGGEWGIGASLTMEHVKPEARGLASGLLQIGYPSGSLLAAAAFGLLVPHFGWRGTMMASILPALLILFIRARVPESPAWAESRKTSSSNLPATALLMGGAGCVFLIFAQLNVFTTLLANLQIAKPIAFAIGGAGILLVMTAFGRKHALLALFAILLMACFNTLSHGSQDFYPTFLRRDMHLDAYPQIVSAIGIAASIGAICGGLTFGPLSQRIGRRRAITLATILLLPIVPVWVFLSHEPWQLAASVFLMQYFVQGAWGVVPAHLNELSPPEARATFPGFVYQLGNLVAASVGLLQASLVEDQHWRYSQALALFAAGAAVAIALFVNLGGEARQATMSVAPVSAE